MIKHYRTLLLVFALFCNTVVIQAQNVSLKLNNVTVKEAIEAVKKQTGKSFFFNVNDVDLNHRVNIDLKDAPLGKALSQILQGQDIDYEVKDNHIVLSKRNSTKNNQTFTVVGQVTDEKGMPLIGVNITAKGHGNTVTDIDYAIEYCNDNPELYRVTKWTAMALKSRVCLFEGTFRKYHGIAGHETFLEECATISKRFIDESPYSIYTSGDKPYRDLFASMNAIQQEVILARDYDYTKGVKHEANYNTMAQTYGRPGMNKKIVNSYLMTDGTRFTDQPGYKTMQYYDEMQNRDPRLTQTVVGPGYMRINSDKVESPNFSSSTTGYQIIKWVTDASGDGYMGSSNDYILFRAAEVYLNYAEAKAELGTLTQEDLKISIKKIRDRVGMPNIDMLAANANPDPYLCAPETGYRNVTGPNKGVILEIRRERTIELCLEGHRYYDIIRWKEGKMFEQPFLGMYFPGLTQGSGDNRYDVFDMNDGIAGDKEKVDICIYTGKKPSVKNIRKFYKLGEEFVLTDGDKGNIICHDIEKEPRQWNEERDYFFPIPTTERSLTNGALTQNPGWNDGLDF